MEQNIEHQIVEAARKMFLKKGFENVNMADIAAEVGLTRPAMHYYFRTKERLFQAIFGDILMSFLPAVSDTISSDLTLEEKLERITDKYLTILNNNPSLPLFLINETQRDLEGFIRMALSNDVALMGRKVFDAFAQEMAAGRIRKVPQAEIFFTFYGLVTFPYISRGISSEVFGQENIDIILREKWRNNVVRHMMLLLSPNNEQPK